MEKKIFGILVLVIVISMAMVEGIFASPLGLISSWHFDEGAGTATADSADGNDGTILGATWTGGVCGEALSFDGINDAVRVPETGGNLDGLSQLTIDAWIFPENLQSSAIVSKYDTRAPGDSSYGLFLSADGRITFPVYDNVGMGVTSPSGWGFTSTNPVISTGSWQHVAVVWAGGTGFSLYIDGTQVPGIVTVFGNPEEMADNPTPVNIGRVESFSGSYTGPGAYLNGKVDGAAIYNRALSADEIESIYRTGLNCLYGDENKGHGNDADGVDEDNPGRGCENKNANGNRKRC